MFFYELIIVGCGPVGLTAGVYAMRAALKTVLIEIGIHGILAVGDLRQKYANQIVLAPADGCTEALSAAHSVETPVRRGSTTSLQKHSKPEN